jgi:ATP-dependent RNA helicase RhlE
LVCVDEHDMLKDIEKLIKRTLPREVVAGFEPDPNARAQPVQLRSGNGGGRGQPQGRSAAVKSRVAPAAKPQGPGKTFGGTSAAKPSAPRRAGGRGR